MRRGNGNGGFPGFARGQRGNGAGQAQAGGRFPGGRGGFAGGGQFPGGQGGFGTRGTPGTRGGGIGGLLDAAKPSAAIVKLFKENASSYTWVAAAVGSNSAAGYQLATREPVMPIGGFNGSDPSPTLAQFKQYVSEKKIHYFIGGRGFGQQNGRSNDSSSIASWVEENFTARTVDGVTLYDLTTPATSATSTSADTTTRTA